MSSVKFTIDGAEIEDQGGSGTSGSHLERRNYYQEVMAGIVGYTRISPISLESVG